MGRASAEAKNRWNAKNYDRIGVMVPKGRKAEIAAHAAARGESVNGFIGRAITETMNRDATSPQDALERVSGSGATPIPSDAETLSEAAKSGVEGG